MVLEKRRALTMEVETIKDALKEKKLQDMIKVYMGQRGIEEYHTITVPLPSTNPAMEPEGSSRRLSKYEYTTRMK